MYKNSNREVRIVMKRYIRANLSSTADYEEARARNTTIELLKNSISELKGTDNCSIQLRSCIVDGIMNWKSEIKIHYHHYDFNTNNNDADNIIFVSPEAHGYLHSTSTELKLYRHFGLLYPGYPQGRIAERLEMTMYKKLGEVLKFKDHNASQVVDVIKNNLSDIKSYSEEDRNLAVDFILDKLNIASIHFISYEDIYDIILNSSEDFNESADVIYVDDDTAYCVLDILNNLSLERTEDEDYQAIREKSLEAIKQFISYNKMSKTEILEIYQKIQDRNKSRV